MPPGALEDLTPAERLLLLAWRRSAAPGGGACVDLTWRLGGGDDAGARCAPAFRALCARLAAHARRPLVAHPPHASLLSMDERCLLQLTSACQTAAPALAVALARWLARPPAHLAVLASAAALARAMDGAGLALRAPYVLRAGSAPLHPAAAAPVPAPTQHLPTTSTNRRSLP